MPVSSEAVSSHRGTRELSPGSGNRAEEGMQVLRICSSCHETRNQTGDIPFLTSTASHAAGLSEPISSFR